MARPTSSSRSGSKEASSRAPARLSDLLERWVLEEVPSRARRPRPVLEPRRVAFEQELEPFLAQVEELLSERAWILSAPSLVDAGVYGALSPLRFVGGRVPLRYPRIRAWSRRVAARGRRREGLRDRRRTMK